MSSTAEHVHDLVGVGFGPSNLSLAIALREQAAELDAVFLEKQPAFGWHRGALIEGTTMQVSFLKDLATMRNPSSEYSFLNYLQERGRLVDFINHKTMFPSRVEFHDYLEWAATRFSGQVEFGAEVVAIRPVLAGAEVVACEVVVRDAAGDLVTRRGRNIVVATGLEPVLPPSIRLGERVWHSSELLHRISKQNTPKRLIGRGAGRGGAGGAGRRRRAGADAGGGAGGAEGG